MNLESIPNELLLELFGFFDAIELFRAFYGLNRRFDALLLTQYRNYRVNFYSTVKYQSNSPSLPHLPLIIHQIVSLHLSDNNDEGLPQTNWFLSSGLLINHFIHLESLSLCHVEDEVILRKLIVDCHQLAHLTHLKIVQCHAKYMSSREFSNTLWTLSKLTHCHLDMQDTFCMPTALSLSIKYLSISCQYWQVTQTADLLRQTPRLCHLHMPLNHLKDNCPVTLPTFSSITILNLFNVRSLKAMNAVLLAVPNLTYLKVDMYYIHCDGSLWEEIIDGHLSKLQAFHLRMHIPFRSDTNHEQGLQKLVDSFCTDFWLKKHQWYIRCHYSFNSGCKAILLYSLPYTFNDFNLNIFTTTYKTTCPRDANNSLYYKVNNLRYDSLLSEGRGCVQFFNLQNLSIHLPFNKHFEVIVPTLHRLNSLTILSTKENAPSSLQSLLDRAPCLYSLTIQSWPFLQVPLVENTSSSVRQFDLRLDGRGGTRSFFSEVECHHFMRSPLGIQCEELLIKLDNYRNIIDLINHMENLRLLIVECQLRSSSFERCERESDVLIKWIRDQLPTTSTISKSRLIFNSLKLWIWTNKG